MTDLLFQSFGGYPEVFFSCTGKMSCSGCLVVSVSWCRLVRLIWDVCDGLSTLLVFKEVYKLYVEILGEMGSMGLDLHLTFRQMIFSIVYYLVS